MIVLATASGSSLISFAMKLDQPPFSAAEASQPTSKVARFDGGAAEVDDLDAVGADGDELVLPDLHRALGELDEGGDVGAEEVLALAEADHERRVAASADDDAGLVGVHGEEREGALEPVDDGEHRRGQVVGLLVGLADEQCGDLGVGLAVELGAARRELRLQLAEVLDDAVVDEGELAAIAQVRDARCRR